MSQSRIVISEGQDEVAAELVDNDAARELVRMLPLTIDMRDHLRQEKTGIVVVGRVEGDVSRFDRPGPVTVRIESSDAASMK